MARSHAVSLVAGAGLAIWLAIWLAMVVATPASHAGPAAAQPTAAGSLRSRVTPPDDFVIQAYIDSGIPDPKPHKLTDDEWVKVDAALERLPEMYRRALQLHLRSLAFIEVPPGGGNALTRDVDPKGTHKQFDITLRAGLLHETLTEFLNGKERGVFEPDGSGTTVTIEAGDTSALIYVLIHESTHVVDAMLKLSDAPSSEFGAGIWVGRRDLAPAYDQSPLNATTFRRGPKTPIGQAQALYQALSRTPFVSLYATAAAPEDLAELVAWQQMATQLRQTLAIVVKDAQGKVVYRHAPLESPLVRRRFAAVKKLLARKID